MKILLADDHDLVRDALVGLLRKDDSEIDITAVSDLDKALDVCRQGGAFDVIILDLRMPGMNGLSGIRKMHAQMPGTPVVLMSGNASSTDVHSAIELGVKGFVPKTLSGKSLINALRLVAAGETYVPAEFLSNRGGASSTAVGPSLTVRELQVLSELRSGNSNKEISRTLDIAETTVKLHLRSLSEKLNARNRTDIVIRAIDLGIV